MRVLVVTNMYPTESEPGFAPFVAEQVEAVRGHASVAAVEVLVIDGRASKLNYLRAYPQMWAALRRGHFQVVHAHYGLSGLVAVVQRRAPVVITFHGSDVDGDRWSNRLQRAGSRIVARLARVNVTVSARIQNRLGVPSRLIPCGIWMDRFVPLSREKARADFGVEPGQLAVLFPSSPKRPEKEFGRFTEVLAYVRECRPDVRPLILENISRDRVPALLAAADVMLMTSSTEGSPVAVMEAMACGLPVVSTDVGDVGSMLDRSEKSFVAPYDPRKFADAVVRLGESGASHRQPHGRAEDFDMRNVVSALVAAYQDAVSAGVRGIGRG